MTRGDPSEPRKVFVHLPVMADEVIEDLRLNPGDTVVDVTVGGGGHAALILEGILPSGTLIGIDRDEDALTKAREKLGSAGERVELVHGRMSEIESVLDRLGVSGADAVLADLGVSSFQFDHGPRGFSIRNPGPLDMRMDRREGRGAREIIRESDSEELERIFRELGEERHARRIARSIAGRDIETTAELAGAVEAAISRGRRRERIHPATRVFQALRIAVNDELGELRRFIEVAPGVLRRGGRLVVISYHSLEDRIVKRAFRELASREGFELPHRRALKPSDEEVSKNPRARSAKLRALLKVVE